MPHYKVVRNNQKGLIEYIFNNVTRSRTYHLDNKFHGDDIPLHIVRKNYEKNKCKMKLSDDMLHVMITFHPNWWYELDLNDTYYE